MDVETVKIDPRTQQSSAIKKSRPELLESDQINKFYFRKRWQKKELQD